MTLTRAAIFYTNQLQIPVLPLRQRAKVPITANGYKNATLCPTQIQEWWKVWPDANIGGVTGKGSGLIVVDVDGIEGKYSLDQLEQRFGSLPLTPKSHTGRGFQLFFKAPEMSIKNRVNFLPGLDLRSDGGYVVLPPSVHPNGRVYRWDESVMIGVTPTASLPGWFLQILLEKDENISGQNTELNSIVELGAKKGCRNDSIAKLAGHLFRHNVDRKIAEVLILSWNERKNDPPLPKREVIQTINSISKLETNRRKNLLECKQMRIRPNQTFAKLTKPLKKVN